jgi:hypothetical protein
MWCLWIFGGVAAIRRSETGILKYNVEFRFAVAYGIWRCFLGCVPCLAVSIGGWKRHVAGQGSVIHSIRGQAMPGSGINHLSASWGPSINILFVVGRRGFRQMLFQEVAELRDNSGL